MPTLEFFYDCSSPWTYLAFHRVEPLAEECGADLVWRPILVGGVFNTVNQSVYAQREAPVIPKARYHAKDLADWARHTGLAIGSPAVFPVNSVRAMRGCLYALEQGCVSEHSRAVFEAYWGDGEDISQDDVLRRIAERVGLDPDAYLDATRADEYKKQLRANTEELIARGGFGSPTMFVDGEDMYFGNDRLVLVREALGRGAGGA